MGLACIKIVYSIFFNKLKGFYLIFHLLDLAQNSTIEERVSLLELQVADLEENMVDLDEDVDFLFDDQLIQDERLLNLEEATDVINAQLVTVDDELEGEERWVTTLPIKYYYGELFSQYHCRFTGHNSGSGFPRNSCREWRGGC